MRVCFFAIAAVGLLGCATYQDDLARGQKAFIDNQHERALAILRSLELDTGHLSIEDRARYAYLRGMTDYRIGYKPDARHWLAVANSIEEQTPHALPPEWAKRGVDALKELNDEVYARGIQSLSNAPDAKAKGDAPLEKPAPTTDKPTDRGDGTAAEKPPAKKPESWDH